MSNPTEDTTVTPNLDKSNNDPKKSSQESVTEDNIEETIKDMFLMTWRDATAGLGAEKHVVCNAATSIVMRRIKAQQTALIERIEREVIGEDEDPRKKTYLLAQDEVPIIRNQLRAEQRTKLAQIKEELCQ